MNGRRWSARWEKGEDFLHPLNEAAQLVLTVRVHVLRERCTLATRTLELATGVMSMARERPVEPIDGRLLFNAAPAGKRQGWCSGYC
jgi:hypothetical protein